MNEDLSVVLQGESAKSHLPPVVWNEADVSAALSEMLESYQGRQYTEDEIKNAKADRAAVNKIEKQLAEAQKRVTELYRQPVLEFVEKMKAYREKTKQVSAAIDAQVKAVEKAAREEKRELFREVWRSNIGDELRELIPFERLLDPRWLNASAPFESCRKELITSIETRKAEIEILRSTCSADFDAVERVYLQNLSIRDALAEHKRIGQLREQQARAEKARKLEAAALAAAPILEVTQEQADAKAAGIMQAESNKYIDGNRLDVAAIAADRREKEAMPYDFRAWLMPEDISALKDFFAARGIRYGKVR